MSGNDLHPTHQPALNGAALDSDNDFIESESEGGESEGEWGDTEAEIDQLYAHMVNVLDPATVAFNQGEGYEEANENENGDGDGNGNGNGNEDEDDEDEDEDEEMEDEIEEGDVGDEGDELHENGQDILTINMNFTF